MGEGIDATRLRNWARGCQQLMRGGLGEKAHIACADDFASDEGEYPYITAADVLGLLDERDALRAQVERVRAVVDDVAAMAERQSRAHNVDGAVCLRWSEDRLRAALDGPQ